MLKLGRPLCAYSFAQRHDDASIDVRPFHATSRLIVPNPAMPSYKLPTRHCKDRLSRDEVGGWQGIRGRSRRAQWTRSPRLSGRRRRGGHVPKKRSTVGASITKRLEQAIARRERGRLRDARPPARSRCSRGPHKVESQPDPVRNQLRIPAGHLAQLGTGPRASGCADPGPTRGNSQAPRGGRGRPSEGELSPERLRARSAPKRATVHALGALVAPVSAARSKGATSMPAATMRGSDGPADDRHRLEEVPPADGPGAEGPVRRRTPPKSSATS